MKALVEGLKIDVTIGCAVKCARAKTDRREGKDESVYEEVNNLDVTANADISISMDKEEASVDIGELNNLIKDTIHNSIKDQIKQQLDAARKEETKSEK